MTYDASNRKDIRAAEKESDRLNSERIEFLRAAMSYSQGRRWFHTLLSDCACFVDIPTFEPNKDYFSSGRRSVGLQILAEILTHCPDQYREMMREEDARVTAATERRRRQDSRRDDDGREGRVDIDPDLFDTDPAGLQ